MVTPSGRIVAGGMLREGTPIQDYRSLYGLWVKREDLACLPPGPRFSKARGVYARIASRTEKLFGVLDTRHSQAGHAVARACQVLGRECINYYPEYKAEPGPRGPQLAAHVLGATLHSLPAGRSAILFHAAKKDCESRGGYMMPNALKLSESVEETAKEVPECHYDVVVIPVSSGTIAAGVVRGFVEKQVTLATKFILHLGYSRSHAAVLQYVWKESGYEYPDITIVDEKYDYKDTARPGENPAWPCNEYYDLKAFRWWMEHRHLYQDRSILFWNIG